MQHTVLITAARTPIALKLARHFHAGGHRVIAVDTMRFPLSRFSKAVSRYLTIPSPRANPHAFIKQMVEIVNAEKVDLIVPVYEEVVYLAQARSQLPPHCRLFSPPFDLLHDLHHKWLFNTKLGKMDLERPYTELIRSQEDLRKLDPALSYALKPCYSRASLHVKKWERGQAAPEIEVLPGHPWVAQEWLEGDAFCTYSICQEGKLLAHATYPVGYTADNKGCIVFTSVDHPEIARWVEQFVQKTRLTGQIAFDFIVLPNRQVHAIECNPRATNGLLLFDESHPIDQLFFSGVDEGLRRPEPDAKIQFFTAMLLYGWRRSATPDNTFRKFLKELCVKDVVFDRKDAGPFFSQPLLFLEIWLNSLKTELSFPAYFVYDYEWNGHS